MPRNPNNNNGPNPGKGKVTETVARAIANDVGRQVAGDLINRAQIVVEQGAPKTTVIQGQPKVNVSAKPPKAAANTDVKLHTEWGQVPVRIDGVVEEYKFTSEQYVAKYIPITRIEQVTGPTYPDSNGNALQISESIFTFGFASEQMTLSSSRLSNSSSGAASVSGI